MYKGRADDVQAQADTAHNHNQPWIFDTCGASDESRALDGRSDSRSIEMNLSIDCKKMLIPRARRKTPLKKAPSNRARCQPNESSAGERARSEI